MAFLAQEELSPETNTMKVSIIQEANPIKDKVSFCYYWLTKGIPSILSVVCQRGHPALARKSGRSILLIPLTAT